MKIYDKEGTLILDIAVDDNSYRYRAIMGEHSLTLYYSLAEHVEIPLGAYCDYQGERYTLERPEALKMQHSRMFNYTVTMEAVEVLAKRWKFRNPVDGRLKFTLTAKPHEHLQMFVDNMNARDGGWTVGDCVEGVETMISYDHAYCSDALAQMANEFKTEYEFNGKRVSLRKLEYNKDNPLPLSYGKGNGFKSGVGRTNEGDTPPIEILYTQGGSDNIDPSKYGSTELLLPIAQTLAYDGDRFEGEAGFDAANARTYVSSADGRSIQRGDKPLSSLAEDSLDCSSISPKRVGTVSEVVTVDAAQHLYDFTDGSIPQALDYEACLIAGETMTVIFQSGMLAGREFDVKYYHEAVTEEEGTSKAARRFEIVPQEIDGQTMPNGTFCPRPGDTYAVFHCMLPDAYICDNASKTGASWDMFREAVRYLYENEEQRFSFTGELDGIWSKKDWENIGGRIVLGGYILFSEPRFQPEGVRVRITGVKDYINKPYSPVIELSNMTVTGGIFSTLKDLVSQEVVNEERHREALGFTKRRWRDVMETLTMMFDPEGDYFTELIKPLAVHTAQLIVGTNSQQMDFVGVRFIPNKGGNANLFAATAGKLVHFTISEDGVREWTIPATADIALREEEAYYVYAKCSRTGTEGQIICSTQQIKLEDDPNYYHFLVGILNTPYDGSRSWNPNYGYTEIAGQTITTGTIKDKSGQSYFDLTNNQFRMGGDGGSISWNEENSGQLRLQGCLYQSPAGDVDYPEVDRGDYSGTIVYYPGDKVSYEGNVYKCIKQTTAGIAPTNETYWKVLVSKGADGAPGKNGQNGIDGQDGEDGKDGAQGLQGPAAPFQGEYSSTKTYYGNTTRTDVVKYNDTYYVARNDAPETSFKGEAPTNTDYWSPFGATFSSVATDLLLAKSITAGMIDTTGLEAEKLNCSEGTIANFTITQGQLTGGNGAGISVSYTSNGTTYQAKLGWGTRSSNGGSTIFWSDNASIGKLHCDEIVCYDYISDGCLFNASSGGLGVLVGGSGLSGNGIWGKNNGNTGNLYLNSGAPSTALVKITNCSCSDASDERIKTIFYDVPNVLDKLEGISAFYYTFKEDEDKILKIGVSAQAVKEVFPEAVTLITPDGYDAYYAVNYNQLLTAVSINGLKELHAKVKALEERVAELEK